MMRIRRYIIKNDIWIENELDIAVGKEKGVCLL